MEPSPTAEVHRLIESLRTSPAAKTPGKLVSRRNGSRERCCQMSPPSTERSNAIPVRTKPRSSSSTAPSSQPVLASAPDGSWLVDGMLAAEELKERLGLQVLPGEEKADYQTVGGMVMDTLGRVPAEGDRLEWEGYSFEVLDMDGRRVDKVLIASKRDIPPGETS